MYINYQFEYGVLQETKTTVTTRNVQILINTWLRNDRFYAEINDVTIYSLCTKTS